MLTSFRPLLHFPQLQNTFYYCRHSMSGTIYVKYIATHMYKSVECSFNCTSCGHEQIDHISPWKTKPKLACGLIIIDLHQLSFFYTCIRLMCVTSHALCFSSESLIQTGWSNSNKKSFLKHLKRCRNISQSCLRLHLRHNLN